jgi:hypothetical protein
MIDIRQRIHLVIREDCSITAKTENTYGEDCLPRIDLLEDMLEALTFDSTFTDDYSKKISNVDVVSGINLETSA